MAVYGILTLPVCLIALSWLARFFAQRLYGGNLSWPRALLHSAVVWLCIAIASFVMRIMGPAGIFVFIALWFLVHGVAAAKLLGPHILGRDNYPIGAVPAAKIGILAGLCLFLLGVAVAMTARYL